MKQKHILMAAISCALLLVLIVGGLIWKGNQTVDIPTSSPPSISTSSSTEGTEPDDTTTQAPPSGQDSVEPSEGNGADEIPPEGTAANHTTQQPTEAPDSQSTEEVLAQQQVDDAMAQLYEAEDGYMSTLNQLVAEVLVEVQSLPAEEQTLQTKLSLMNARSEDISAMESDCDALVEDLLLTISRAQMILGDMDMVNEIRSYYSEAKASYKADCLTALTIG